MKFADRSVTLSKTEARAILAHTSKDRGPQYEAAFFDGRDLIVMATDGHRGLVAKGTGDVSEWRTLVPRKAIEAALVARVASLTIETDDETGLLGTITAHDKRGAQLTALPFAWPLVEKWVSMERKATLPAEFPPLKTCIPRAEERGSVAGINAKYLADVALVQEAAAEGTEENYAATAYCPPSNCEGQHKFIAGSWIVSIMPHRLGNIADRGTTVMRDIRATEDSMGPTRDHGPQKKAHAKAT